MLSTLTNLTKGVLAVAIAPAAVVADVLTLPASSFDPHRSPFGKTEAVLKAAGDCFMEAVKPEKEKP